MCWAKSYTWPFHLYIFLVRVSIQSFVQILLIWILLLMIDFHKVWTQVLCQIYRCMDFKHFLHFGDRYRYCYCCSGVKSHWTLCDPKSCSMPGSPILHYLPEFAQTHVQWVSDAIQQSHILSPPSPPSLNISQHQGLFQWVGSSQQMAKELEIQHQHQSFQWISRVALFQDWLVWSFCYWRDSQESSPEPQFESIYFSALSLLYGPTLFMVLTLHDYWEKI